MKNVLFFVVFGCCSTFAFGQTTIQWQKCYGGTDADDAYAVRQCSDGGYVIVGSSLSIDGDVTGGHGNTDFWILKTDPSGVLQWQKSFGGTGNEIAYDVRQTSDAGFIVGGYSTSNDGDVTGNHGSADFWVVKLDGSGNLQWQKCLGGTGGDVGYSLDLCNNGYVVTGISNSTDGDVTGNHFVEDFWVVRLDTTGNIVWENSYGGSWDEYPYSISHCTDGGFVVAGFTQSNDGDVSGLHGSSFQYDDWVIKLDSTGILQWQKCLGGTGSEVAYSVKQTADGGFIVGGQSSGSNDGDVTGNHGASDYWVLKLDTAGNLQWQKCLGGTGSEIAYSVWQCSNGNFSIAGYSDSNDSDVTGNHGTNDYWIVNVNDTGTIQWQVSLGGSAADEPRSIVQTNDGGFIIAGHTYSGDGDVTGFHAASDYWLVKLAPLVDGNEVNLLASQVEIFPNPFSNETTIRFGENMAGGTFIVYDDLGQKIIETKNITCGEIKLNRGNLQPGIYFFHCVKNGESEVTGRIVVTN